MHRVISSFFALVVGLCLACVTLAQESPSAANATCNFDDERQVVVQYQQVPVSLKKPLSNQVPFGRPWAPGGKPMTLFTNTPLQIRSTAVPLGAYTIFVIPDAKQWTLIVSKSTDMSGAYNQQDDLVRVPMESGELPTPESNLSVSFAHTAPNQCNIRIDLEKRGHFAEFMAK